MAVTSPRGGEGGGGEGTGGGGEGRGGGLGNGGGGGEGTGGGGGGGEGNGEGLGGGESVGGKGLGGGGGLIVGQTYGGGLGLGGKYTIGGGDGECGVGGGDGGEGGGRGLFEPPIKAATSDWSSILVTAAPVPIARKRIRQQNAAGMRQNLNICARSFLLPGSCVAAQSDSKFGSISGLMLLSATVTTSSPVGTACRRPPVRL